jgi:nicotinamide mononucleotide transporter
MIDPIWQAILQLSGWEAIAMLLGLVYIILAIKESIWAWPSAFVSTLIYTILFWEGQLPLQAILNFYYLIMATYGFWLWKQPDQSASQTFITNKPFSFHLIFVFIGGILTLFLGWFNAENNLSKLPYLDSFVMVFSMMNTFLMAKKIIENWLYWQAEFYLTIVLFVIFLVLVVIGYRKWHLKLFIS